MAAGEYVILFSEAESVYRKLPLKDLMKTEAQKELYNSWIQEANN